MAGSVAQVVPTTPEFEAVTDVASLTPGEEFEEVMQQYDLPEPPAGYMYNPVGVLVRIPATGIPRVGQAVQRGGGPNLIDLDTIPEASTTYHGVGPSIPPGYPGAAGKKYKMAYDIYPNIYLVYILCFFKL